MQILEGEVLLEYTSVVPPLATIFHKAEEVVVPYSRMPKIYFKSSGVVARTHTSWTITDLGLVGGNKSD